MTNETVVHAVYETMCCQIIYIYTSGYPWPSDTVKSHVSLIHVLVFFFLKLLSRPMALHVFSKLTRWSVSYMCRFRWFEQNSRLNTFFYTWLRCWFYVILQKIAECSVFFWMVKFGFLIARIFTQYSPNF